NPRGVARRCIARGWELWFEKRGCPLATPAASPPDCRRCEAAAPGRFPSGGAADVMASINGFEGATMFKRLTAAATTGALATGALVVGLLAGVGAASAGLGQPSNWQMGLQQSATPVMDFIVSFHNYLLVVITLISLFV